MKIKVSEENWQIDDILTRVEKFVSGTIKIGPAAADKDAKILLIALVHEYGAKIKSAKAIAYFWKKMKEAGIEPSNKSSSGTGNGITIPARRPMATAAYSPELEEKLARISQIAFDKMVHGEITSDQALDMIGIAIADVVRSYYGPKNLGPPNHPLTSHEKGGGNTLHHKGVLQKAIQHEVTHA